MSAGEISDGRVLEDTTLLRVGLAAGDAALRIKRAGRAAQRLSRLASADPHIEHAPSVQCAIELSTELGHLGENDPGAAIQVANSALAVIEDLPPGPWSLVVEVQAELTRGEALVAVGDVVRARGCLTSATRSLDLPMPDHPLTSRVRAGAKLLEGQCAAADGDLETAVCALREAIALGEDSPGLRSLALARLAQVMLDIGEHDMALAYVDRALDADEGPQSDAALARLHGIRAEILLAQGALEAALVESERAVDLAAAGGVRGGEHRRRVANVKAVMGDPTASDELERLAKDEASRGEVSPATILALATAHLRAGDPEAAVRALTPYRLAGGLPPAQREAVYDVLTEAAERTGDAAGALALLKEQRDVTRADHQDGGPDRARQLAEDHQVDLLRADLERSRQREQQLRLLVRQRTAELTWRSAHDELTGLYSREALLARLREPVSEGVWRTVLYLDLDRFKVVNDAHGHDVGDALLSVVGRRLETAVLGLEGRTLVARLGGDEFCVLVDTDGPLDAVALAEVLSEELSAPVDLPSLGPVRPEISIGVTQALPTAPRPVGDTDLDLLRDADVALHRSKSEGGGGIYVFGRADREQAVRRFEVEHRVRRAIEEGRILPAYDPIVDLADGRVVGVESLCRMAEDGELVRAAEFIEIAEESGLIDALGRIVTAAAIRDLAAAGRSQFVAINLGPRELRRPGLLDDLRRRLDAVGMPMDRLVVEITERSFVDVASTEAGVLRDLAAAGVQLAIDDFSTGHSSMVHLSWMPVRLLKIDRSLVVRAAHSASERTLVSAVISMAQTLGLKVVAEGIESPDVCRVLRDLGCDYAQGHLFLEHSSVAEMPERYDLEAMLGS